MKRALLVTLLISAGARSQTPVDLSLEDALNSGKENSRMLHVAVLKADAAAAKAQEARTALLPTIKFDGSYRRLSDITPFALTFAPLIPTPIEINPNIPNVYNLRVGLQEPLFAGFRLQSNAGAAGYLADAAEAERKGGEADLVLTIVNAYWSLYQTIQVKKFVDENVARLKSYRADTQNLMKTGMATRNDLLKIDLQLSNARLAQVDAENDVDVAMMNLNNVLGQPADRPLHITSTPAMPAREDSLSVMPDVLPADSLVGRAMTGRDDLAAMQSRVEASRLGVTAAQAGWWPQVNLTANYAYARPNQRYLPAVDKFKGTWEVGIGMQFDIWNWGTTLYQTDQARSQLLQNELLLDQLRDNAALEVRRSRLAVVRAAKRITVAHEAINQADENARTTDEKYRNGLATSTDVLDASLAVLQARTNATGALVEHEITLARLRKAVGE
jgi:outer membrane protein TolC